MSVRNNSGQLHKCFYGSCLSITCCSTVTLSLFSVVTGVGQFVYLSMEVKLQFNLEQHSLHGSGYTFLMLLFEHNKHLYKMLQTLMWNRQLLFDFDVCNNTCNYCNYLIWVSSYPLMFATFLYSCFTVLLLYLNIFQEIILILILWSI